MAQKIYFDMDGTIADLYGVEGWLADLQAGIARPYAEAKPMVNMSRLARRLNALQKKGCKVCILSWLAIGGSAEYDEAVTQAKIAWLGKHLASVKFDEIKIVAHGTPKHTLGNGILFDDEKINRDGWGEGAHKPEEIFEVLAQLA